MGVFNDKIGVDRDGKAIGSYELTVRNEYEDTRSTFAGEQEFITTHSYRYPLEGDTRGHHIQQKKQSVNII